MGNGTSPKSPWVCVPYLAHTHPPGSTSRQVVGGEGQERFQRLFQQLVGDLGGPLPWLMIEQKGRDLIKVPGCWAKGQ